MLRLEKNVRFLGCVLGCFVYLEENVDIVVGLFNYYEWYFGLIVEINFYLLLLLCIVVMYFGGGYVNKVGGFVNIGV